VLAQTVHPSRRACSRGIGCPFIQTEYSGRMLQGYLPRCQGRVFTILDPAQQVCLAAWALGGREAVLALLAERDHRVWSAVAAIKGVAW
jgi:hypothetical protein